MLSEKLRRTGRVRLRFSLGSTKPLDLEEDGPVETKTKPTEYPAKVYVRTRPDWHYPGGSIMMTTAEKSVLPQLDGDRETEVAVYQLVRVAKFKRVVTEVIESEPPTFRKVTTEIVEEV